MSTVLKRLSLVGVAALLAVTVVGCGSEPAKAGSAAIVGGQTIDLETVQDRTVTVLKKEPAAQQMQDQGKLDQVSRLVLADEITHRIADHAAQREGITVDETEVYDAVQEKGGPEEASKQSEQDATTIHRRQRDVLVMGELARRNLTTLEVVIDFFQVRDPKEAKEKAAEVTADPSKMARFIQEAPRTASGQQASATGQRVRVTENPSLVHTMLWGVEPGTVVAFPADEQQASWMVALVKERNKVSASPGEEDLGERIDPRLLAAFGLRIAQYLAADLDIEVNPRYGVWDPTDATVVGSAGERAGFVGVPAARKKS
ncbi:SurA N-terminal domain-containing protein [Lentzea fradiae]|uniref:SurA N-terminal domain-containing protein n=1 Tax=Lentzea fradiae TaxID=200378 RepID=A0A1G7X460_9PSEU|nr:SurA N-terminal domain-containing protein [Lentzea fradiae]SDG78955.1 SurA N-terminal domain-containing protein [Lentzea fradiae]